MTLSAPVIPVLPERQPLAMAAAQRPNLDRASLRKAAAEFEGFFLGMLMKQMRAAVPKSELFHGGQGEDVFQELLDGEYARRLAERGGFGLADLMVESLVQRNRGVKQYASEGAKR